LCDGTLKLWHVRCKADQEQRGSFWVCGLHDQASVALQITGKLHPLVGIR
jgi:hypothetical protein